MGKILLLLLIITIIVYAKNKITCQLVQCAIPTDYRIKGKWKSR